MSLLSNADGHRSTPDWPVDKVGRPLSKNMRHALELAAENPEGWVSGGGYHRGITNATIRGLHERGLVVAEVYSYSMTRWTRRGNEGVRYFSEVTGHVTDAGRDALKEDTR